ncbi:MAG: DUF4331 domain-containing protein [Thermodesulfobacteriota bacterium]
MGIRQVVKLSAMLFASFFFIIGGTPHWNIASAANHREAPITALDHKADITDWFAFVSYEEGKQDTVTFILDVDPLLEPSNGPNYFPFDPEIVYKINIDNNQDAEEDIRFEFRFTTDIRLPNVFTSLVGGIAGIPPITSLDGTASTGLSLRQTYTMTMVEVTDGGEIATVLTNSTGQPLFAVPTNVGPRTMPNYSTELAPEGIYTLSNGIRVFAGTVDDPFYIDLGAAFDSLNFRVAVLNAEEDANDTQNFRGACDDVAGFNVNAIALEVPIEMLTSDGEMHSADEPEAVIGSYGVTARPRTKTFNGPGELATLSDDLVKIQRMGNALINELIIGTGEKDKFSMSEPADDGQFADGPADAPDNFFLNPLLATLLNVVFDVPVPDVPRTDLLPLVQYVAPICPGCTTPGPVADLLRLNTGISPTQVIANMGFDMFPDIITKSAFAQAQTASRLGVLAGDLAGYPNGRRVFDDVTDISTRVVAGVLNPDFNVFPNNLLGDGVNTNDVPYQHVFPYVSFANSGRHSFHLNPGGDGCETTTTSGGGGCAIAGAGSNIGISNLAILLVPVLYVFGRRFARRRIRKS